MFIIMKNDEVVCAAKNSLNAYNEAIRILKNTPSNNKDQMIEILSNNYAFNPHWFGAGCVWIKDVTCIDDDMDVSDYCYEV